MWDRLRGMFANWSSRPREASVDSAGLAMGIAVGVGIGVALGNVGIGIAIGVALGAAGVFGRRGG